MDRKQINEAVSETKARTKKIVVLVFCAVILAVCSVVFILVAIGDKTNYYIKYNEKSNLDYLVHLKPNDYFGESLGMDKQYIASLIDRIDAVFNYKLEIDEKIDYSYYYYIDATVEVLDTNKKVLYEKTDEIVPKKQYNPNDFKFNIIESASIDYNYYNTIVNTFIKRYNLTNVTSDVELKMYVGINGKCEEFSSTLADNAVISMNIPLTTNTINIDMNYKLNNGTDKLLECYSNSIWSNKYLIIGILLIIITILLIIYIVHFILTTKSALTIYNQRLRNIFNNYGRYISKIKTEMKYEDFQIVFVEEFEDLFEIRNSSQSPILFYQNSLKNKSAFVVPTNSGVAYIYYYSLKSVESKKVRKDKPKGKEIDAMKEISEMANEKNKNTKKSDIKEARKESNVIEVMTEEKVVYNEDEEECI